MIMNKLMALSKIKYMSSTINLNVITNSRNYSNISQCSLDQLSSDIECIYNYMPEEFIGLAPDNVIYIKNKIKAGKYTLSPFQLITYPTKDDINVPKNSHIIHLHENNSTFYGWVAPTLEDKLVLTALGHMLNHRFVDLDIHYSFSFGYKTYPTSYYAHIRSSIKEPISRLYRIDMNRSLFVIKKEYLLSRLEPIVQNSSIMGLISSFLYMPIKLCGREISSLKECIPPSGFFTSILLNFYLIELDSQFIQLFPSFSYTRYLEEIIVTTSQEDSLFEDSLLEVFARLDLAGKILSIGPGDDPIICSHGGIVRVSDDGRIHIKEDKNESLTEYIKCYPPWNTGLIRGGRLD